jgi:hypothetical protein
LHKAFVIVPILGWLSVGALLHQTRSWPKPEEGVVVLVPPRAPAAAAIPAAPPHAWDRAGMARELHKELKRVGCYDGEVTGSWTSSSRQAMRRFTESVNARLPFEEPDLVLLRLLQSHKHVVCGCRSGSASAAACPETAGVANPPKKSPGEAVADTASTPLIVGAATTVAAAAALPSERGAPAPASQSTGPEAQPSDEEGRRPARQAGPTPPAGMSQTSRRQATRSADQPPVVVQTLIRNVQRALGSLGIR